MKNLVKLLVIILLMSMALIIVIQPSQAWKAFDEKIAREITGQSNKASNRNVFEDLNSGVYQQGDEFLMMQYAKDLGYRVVKFPNFDKNILMTLKYGCRTITIDHDGNIFIKIRGDKWEDGLEVRTSLNEGSYIIDCGEKDLEQKINGRCVFSLASTLINLRTSQTLEEMASKNRENLDKLITTPEILTGFP